MVEARPQPRLPRGVLGYHPGQVREHLERFFDDWSARRRELQQALKAEQERHAEWQRELQALSDEATRAQATQAMLEASVGRAEATASLVQDAARRKAEEIRAACEAELAPQRAAIADLDCQILDARMELGALVRLAQEVLRGPIPELPEVGKVVGRTLGVRERVQSLVSSWLAGTRLRIAVAPSVIRAILPDGTPLGRIDAVIVDRHSGEIAGFGLVESSVPDRLPDGSTISPHLVTAIRKDALVVAAGVLEAERRADGETRSAAEPRSAGEARAGGDAPAAEQPPARDAAAPPAELAAASGASVRGSRRASNVTQLWVEANAQQGGGTPAVDQRAAEAVTGHHGAPAGDRPAALRDAQPEAIDAEGLEHEIEAGWLRFLGGKIVGADLHDRDGRLIARRGEPITREIAAAAEAAGKLPELIIHMTLADLPEELAEESGAEP